MLIAILAISIAFAIKGDVQLCHRLPFYFRWLVDLCPLWIKVWPRLRGGPGGIQLRICAPSAALRFQKAGRFRFAGRYSILRALRDF
jgi:hypothetical protein